MSRNLSDRESEVLEIPLNKTKIIGLILASVMFVTLGFWFITSFATLQTDFSPSLIRMIGAASILFFGVALYYSIKKYFDKKPGLIFSHRGIVDNSNGTSIGLIEWNDITGIKVVEVWKNKSILFQTNAPEKYIAKAGKHQAYLMQANMKTYGTPLCITPQTLKIDFDQLYDLILEKYYLNKKESKQTADSEIN
jgi:hypothetical protein